MSKGKALVAQILTMFAGVVLISAAVQLGAKTSELPGVVVLAAILGMVTLIGGAFWLLWVALDD